MRAVRSVWDEEEFRFTQVEFEVMSSCPSRDDADIQR